MIFRNARHTELDFGSGDIVASPFAANDNSYVGVSFRQADKCYEVGKEFEDYDDYLNFDNEDVIMTFSNVDSIDVVIHSLQKAKDHMLKNMQ